MVPGYFSQYHAAEDKIRAQGGEPAQRSRISDIDQRQAEANIEQTKAQTQLAKAQVSAMRAQAAAGPEMTEREEKALDSNYKTLDMFLEKQMETDFMSKSFKKPDDVEQWNKQIDGLTNAFRSMGVQVDDMVIKKRSGSELRRL